MQDMAGKVALVTGGASGMGRIYARRLAAKGARVALFDVNKDGLDATAAASENLTLERLFRINYFGTTYMVRAVLPSMQARGRGRIIAFGSIAGHALVPKMGAYCATKAAVNAYIEVLQNEIRESGVRAHLVCPPAVNTPLVDQTINTDSPGSIKEAKEKGRLADPEKIIDAIEKGVARDRDIIYPGEARLLYLWRALAPRLWWKTVMNFER